MNASRIRGQYDTLQTISAGTSLQVSPLVNDEPMRQMVVSNLSQTATDVFYIADTEGKLVCPVTYLNSITFECDGPFRLVNLGATNIQYTVGQVTVMKTP